jgi:NodT family efflux transporter outer membrane factor (OMF) lipoprotein
LILLVLVLTGCVAAPERRRPDTGLSTPDRWTASEAATAAPLDKWWKQLNDPLLPAIIDLALERNWDLRAAAARVQRAEAQARIAGADLKPSINASLSRLRQKQNFAGSPVGEIIGLPPGEVPAFTTTATGLSLETSWEIDLWGRLRAGARAGVAELQAAEAELRGAKLSLAGQTAKAWFALTEAYQQARLADDSARSFKKVAEQVRSRYEQGLSPSLELRLALSNMEAAEALLAARREQLDRGMRQLEILLGRYPAGSLFEDYPPHDLPSLPGTVPAGLPSELIARRPDLVAAERRLAAADQRLLQARRALYPRLSLTGSVGSSTEEFSDLLDGDFGVWSLVAGILQPVFQGGRLRAGVDAADATGREALAVYANIALRAYSEVESALAAERRLIEREAHLASSVEQLLAARQLAEDRYRSGLGDYLTVLESQTRALTAQIELINARRSLLDNRVDLHMALGGGFEEGPSS